MKSLDRGRWIGDALWIVCCLFAYVFLATTLGAILRLYSGWTMGLCTALGAVVAGLVFAPFRADLSRLRQHLYACRAAVVCEWACGSLLVFALLWNLKLGGFPSGNGGDGGNHLALARRFIEVATDAPDIFYAQVGFVYAVKALFGVSYHSAYRASFYFTALLVVFTVGIAAASFGGRAAGGRVFLRWSALAALAFPTLSYLQLDGYYWQFYSLIPWILGIFAYCGIEDQKRRLLAWAGAVFLLRYTYALNLGDAFFLLGVLLFRELRSGFGTFLSMISFGLAVSAYDRILGVGLIPGGLLKPDLFNFAAALALGGMGFAVHSFRAAEEPWARRFQRVCALVFMITGFLSLTLWWSSYPKIYYAFKYPMVPVILLGLAFSVAIGVRETVSSQASIPRKWMRPQVVLVFSALLLFLGADVYLPSFRERFIFNETYDELHVLVNEDIEESIRKVLVTRGRPFSGYLTHHWPEASQVNVLFGYDFDENAFDSFRLENVENGCAFWRPSAFSVGFQRPTAWGWTMLSRQSTREKLLSRPDRQCFELPHKGTFAGVPEGEASLCYVCGHLRKPAGERP